MKKLLLLLTLFCLGSGCNGLDNGQPKEPIEVAPADQTTEQTGDTASENSPETNSDRDGTSDTDNPPPVEEENKETIIRLMAANISSTSKQSYAGQAARIFMAIKPDIVLIQEFNYIPNFTDEKYDDQFDYGYQYADRDDFVKKVFGKNYTYVIDDDYDKNNAIPNGIISRFPILESGVWTCTGVVERKNQWARLDIPGDRDLWAISVHLATNDQKRADEAEELVTNIHNNIPAGSYIVLGGDFNHGNHESSTIRDLEDIFVIIKDNYPTDQNGLSTTNTSRAKVNDAIFATPEFDTLEVPVTIAGHDYTYPNGLVFDSRVFTPLTAVAPVLVHDSSANQMQHMPVIRDFKVIK